MTRKSAMKTCRRRSRRSSRAFPDNTSNSSDNERCVGCDAVFPHDARFCDQCGYRRDCKNSERELMSGSTDNGNIAGAPESQVALRKQDRPSTDDSRDAPGGSWFWGSEHPASHAPVLNKNAAAPPQDKRGVKHFTKEHEGRFLKQQRGLKPLTSISLSYNSNNQSARSALKSRRDDPSNGEHFDKSSDQKADPAEQVLHLPPIGISSQQIQFQSLKATKHNDCSDISKSDDRKNISLETKMSAATKCVLWGPCLDEVVSSFQATEIILIAEIDADEGCVSFLKQQVQLSHQQNQQFYPESTTSKSRRRSPRLTQLELKLDVLEKKLLMNKQKLVSVRERLEELRSGGDANRCPTNNIVDECCYSDNSGNFANAGNVLDDLGLHFPTQGEVSHATKTIVREKKRRKSKRRSEHELSDGIISSLDAVLMIQRAFRKLRQASRWRHAVAVSVTTDKSQPGSSRSNRSHENTPTSLVTHVAPSSLSLESAAVRIQSLYRRRAGRVALKRLLAEVYEKVFDPDSNAYYYYSKRTKQSQWEKPILLGDHDLADLLSKAAQDVKNPDPSDPSCQERHQAAQTIQRLYRNRTTRLFLRDLATGTLQKVFDADFGAWYYFNHRTQQSFWENPQHAQITAAREISTTPKYRPSSDNELQAAPCELAP